MSNNVFSKAIKDLLPEIANAIFNEIKVPRVGSQRIRVSGFTRDVLEGIYQHLDKQLTGKNREAYKICFLAERAGKTVPITPVERVMEYRTIPSIKALVVFDPWKIEEYGKHMFLHYSFREFPMEKFLEDFTVERINKAPSKIRNLFYEVRDMFDGNFPHREKELREAMFAQKLIADKFNYAAFGAGLVFFNTFPDAGINEKNAVQRISANAKLSRLFIHSRLPMNERVLLLNPRDKESAATLLEFFIAKDGVLPEFWLLEILEKSPELCYDKWAGVLAPTARRPFVANFEGIGRDRRAEREINITWDMPYGVMPYGSLAFRIWNENVIVSERIQRGGANRFVLDMEGINPGVYQLQVVVFAPDSQQVAHSWSPPFWWPGPILTGAELKTKDSHRISWLHGPVVNDQIFALYDNIRQDPAQKRKRTELLESSPKVNSITFPSSSGDGVQEVVLPDHSRYFVRVPDVFRSLEKLPLEEVTGLNRFTLNLSNPDAAPESIDIETDGTCEDFIKARRMLFMQFKRLGSSPSTCNNITLVNQCTSYLNAYLELLDKMLKSRAKVIKDDVLFIDTVTLVANGKVVGLLTLPTHPVEIAFKMGFQQIISNAWQAIFKARGNGISPFPPVESHVRAEFLKVFSTQDGSHFALVDVPHSGFALYLADSVDSNELASLWQNYTSSDKTSLLTSTSDHLKAIVRQVSGGRSISVAAVGIMTTSGVLRFCRTLAESSPEPELQFDVTFYGTPAGVLDRAHREIERLKREFCLYDLSSDPDIWRQRFPYDRFRLHVSSCQTPEMHHISYILPDFKANITSFESRNHCSLSLMEGLFPINISNMPEFGEVQWSGAGPRKDSSTSEKLFEVVENIHDSFSAASSKVALQKTSAFSHLSVECVLQEKTSVFLAALVANSVISFLASYVGANGIMRKIAPPNFSVGSPALNIAIAVNAAQTPAGIALRRMVSAKLPSVDSLLEAQKSLSPSPLSLYRHIQGEKIIDDLLARHTLSMLSQTRDGVLLNPSHYPDFFGEGTWPMLVLFKFGAEGLIPLVVETLRIPGVDKPDEVTLSSEFLEHLTSCGERLHKLFHDIALQPDNIFTWSRFGEILAVELHNQVMRGEIIDKDATTIVERINAIISLRKVPDRESIREFPLLLLPDAKGQLAGRPFAKAHPLCRMLSGEEMMQWLRK